MESVLHIEPILRHIPAPLSVGHTDHLFYGESLTIDDENVGDVTSHMSVGAPLYGLDEGSHSAHVALVKTVEFMPDFSRKDGNVYLETTHCYKDKSFLIPYRTKLRSGIGMGLRFNHLPSLNLVRQSITPTAPQLVCDPRSEIIGDIALRDEIFHRRRNGALRDWLTYELAPSMDRRQYCPLSFDPDDIRNVIPRYINQVRDTPTEYTTHDLQMIVDTIVPYSSANENMIPPHYCLDTPLVHHISDFRHRLVPNTFDFRSMGKIQIRNLDRIEYNPRKFQDICDLLDCIPLTDFNIDMVIDLDTEIIFYLEHLAINRFGVIQDVDIGCYRAESVVRDFIDGEALNAIIERFVNFHHNLTPEIQDILKSTPVKIKLIKTFSDEAAILLYCHDSAPDDPPLCGVYFDIALQSLAPMSVIPVPLPN